MAALASSFSSQKIRLYHDPDRCLHPGPGEIQREKTCASIFRKWWKHGLVMHFRSWLEAYCIYGSGDLWKVNYFLEYLYRKKFDYQNSFMMCTFIISRNGPLLVVASGRDTITITSSIRRLVSENVFVVQVWQLLFLSYFICCLHLAKGYVWWSLCKWNSSSASYFFLQSYQVFGWSERDEQGLKES